MSAIRVCLAEDNALLREGVARLIETHDDLALVGTAADLLQLLDLVGACEPAGPRLHQHGWGEYHTSVLELADGADLLVHDAHLVADELAAHASFGRAAAEYAVALGQESGAKRVLLFHHTPDRTDDEIDKVLDRFTSGPIRVEAAAEGMVVDL